MLLSVRKLTVFFFFALQANIASALGLSFYSVMYFLLILVFVSFLLSKSKSKYFIFFVVSLIVMLLFRLFNNILAESIQSSFIMCFPALFILTFPKRIDDANDFYFYRFLAKCVIVYICLEFSFSYIEFFGKFSILGYTNDTYGVQTGPLTRATALSGASLSNALIISGLLFVVLNSNLKDKYKYSIWSLGFLSLMCFQGRIAMIISFAYLFVYLIYSMKKNGRKILTLLFFTALVMSIVVVALSMGLGQRLFEIGVFDGSSSGVRTKMFSYIGENLKLKGLLWGMSMLDLRNLMTEMQVLVIECFAIIHLLLFGLVFLLLFYIQYALLIKRLLVNYRKFFKWTAVPLFFVLAFINNSFASDFASLSLFLVFLKLFSPPIFCKVIPQKYLLRKV